MMRKLGKVLVIASLFPTAQGQGEEIDFSRQIRPILSKNCFACHGPDAGKRKAKLRLDTREGALAERKGDAAVVPGKSEESELYARLTHDDPEERMPPEDSERELTAAEIALLKRWIDSGAQYEEHWAFVPPVQRGPLRKAMNSKWAKNPIDHWVLDQIEAQVVKPAPEASRYTLIRRLSFDLRGLPATPEEIEQFVGDQSPKAYEKLVDRFLASPRYGERWARVWMDLARYADTQGYEKDNNRTVWPWRDWVIKVLNDDLPYDQFTIEQIAGDLLPGATSQQVLATVFHRNTMTNTEGGTTDEEFRTAAVKDRIDTTGVIWLGLSVGCAKCHSHKYDPISQKEYYSLYAFLNQTADADRGGDDPKRGLPSPFHYAQQKELVAQIAAARKLLVTPGSDQESAAGEIAKLETQLEQKAQGMKPPAVPIMQELPENRRRKTHLLVKGDFLSPGEEVSAGVPEALHAMPDGAPMNRLGLAQWLVAKDNPLMARVTVNRIWARLFGVGLVETEEDFGTQGELPSHPGLLDWLAVEFRDKHKWSQKKLLKTIVMSATYRQSSKVSPLLLKEDPRNRLFARGPRFRLDAEMIRDQALAVSGLLSEKIYGPPVMPPQPEGIWKTVYNGGKWVTSKGEDRYRRGLYTFTKRTSAYPSFLLMDAGSGEVCLPRRIRTNTTTAALATLNDPVFTEAAQALARRIVDEVKGDASKRAAAALQLVTGRPARGEEVAPLVGLYLAQLASYEKNREDAVAMASDPLGPIPPGGDPAELAAWTVVASVLLNLDEVLTKG